LNDKEELRDGLLVLEESLINDVDLDHGYKEAAINAIRLNLVNVETSNNDLDPLYVFSLSAAKDQLSQWRAYGSYAIEFDPDLLKESVRILAPCLYDLHEKIRRSTDEVKKSIAIIAEEMKIYSGNTGPRGYDSMIHLMHDAATFKHDGFSEEKESRIIMPEDASHEVQYRERNGMLVPFIELKIPLDCVKSIQVGPMEQQDLAFTSMAAFAGKIEHNWQDETSNIEYWLNVEKSFIPYRA
jgi:hypothetical protein